MGTAFLWHTITYLMFYSISFSSKYLVSEWPEMQRPRPVNFPVLEVFVIWIVKLLIISNGDTLVNGIIAHGMFLSL
jgi:hypothetical protein